MGLLDKILKSKNGTSNRESSEIAEITEAKNATVQTKQDFLAVHPGTKMAPRAYIQTDFSQVKDVTLDRESDLILLHEPLRVTHVYVPKEDLPFVLNYILDRVPQSDKIKKRKEAFGKDLKG